jgi:hypothetical protein
MTEVLAIIIEYKTSKMAINGDISAYIEVYR